MRDFEDSTLWNISEFERIRQESGTSGFMRLGGPTLLPTTLLSDLGRLQADPMRGDALEVVAACIRHRTPALLCLQHEGLVWPVTVFPGEMLYHSPRDMALASVAGLAALKVVAAEPPGVKAPASSVYERVARPEHYRALAPLLWLLALHGPRKSVLAEIAGTAAYRLVASRMTERPQVSGALASAVERMQRESVSLRDIAGWPGMSLERASRLLNGLYLTSSLMVTRAHPAARGQPAGERGLFGLRKPKP